MVVSLGGELWLSRALRLGAFDAYHTLAPRVRRSAPAVIIAIDDASLDRHGQWPWPRTMLAQLLARVASGRPAAVGIVIVMPEADRLSPNRLPQLVPGIEAGLAQRLSRLPSTDAVLGATLRQIPAVLGVAGLASRESPVRPLARRTPVRVHGGDARTFVRSFATALRSVDPIDDAAAGRGLVNADPDADVVRRLPLVAAVGEDLMPALGIEMLRVASRQPSFSVRVGQRGIDAVSIGDLVVPTQPDATVWLHYARWDPARLVSAADVLSGRADPRQFERKLVLVGVTAVGLGDHHPTPVGARMPGVEIHAQLLENIFDGELLVRPRWTSWVEAAFLLAGGVLLIVVVPALNVRTSVLIVIALLAMTLLAGFLGYLRYRILLDAAGPALGLALTYAGVLSVTLAETQAQRRALRRQLDAEREAAARVAGELAAARRIQMGILPAANTLAGEERVSVYAFLEPALVVGGDLYDLFRLDHDRLFFLIGDVSGKGVPGSLFMAVSKALSKSAALRCGGDLARTMNEANAEIARDNPEALFVTAWAGVLDARTGGLQYSNAGHEPAWLLDGDRSEMRRLAGGEGPPLCVLDDFPYTAVARELRPGETVCLVTDGVTEAMNPAGELYGRARLENLLGRLAASTTVADIGEAIHADVSRFTAGAEPSDDLTILIVRWNGPGGGQPHSA